MDFTYNDYLTFFSGAHFPSSQGFLGKHLCDPNVFFQISTKQKGKLSTEVVFKELKKRIPADYFYQIYPVQTSALSFSNLTFPLYRFLLPDDLAEDWLAMIGFHKSFSRDHSLHQPLTAYVVHTLLGGGNPKKALEIGNDNILDLAVNAIIDETNLKTAYLRDFLQEHCPQSALLRGNKTVKVVLWRRLFYETAICAALFHDTGYPWQYVGRLHESLSVGDFRLPIEKLNETYIYDTFQHRLVFYPFFQYRKPSIGIPSGWKEKLFDLIKLGLNTTHGFPGALGFLYLNDMTRPSPFPRGEELALFSQEWAALAIMMHDMVGVYWGKNSTVPKNKFLRLDYKCDPLSCVIALADFLEDFNRPSVSYKTPGSLEYSTATDKIVLSINKNHEAEINFTFTDSSMMARCISHKHKETKEYFDATDGFVDISSLGLKRVKSTFTVAETKK